MALVDDLLEILSRGWSVGRHLALLALLVFFSGVIGHDKAAAENIPANPSIPLPLEEILSRMDASIRLREKALAGYTALRTYRAANGDSSDRKAEMQVKVVYSSPATKDFTIVSEDGSEFIRSKVFKRAMETEKEALGPELKQRSALTSENYLFLLVGQEILRGRRCYVLDANPKRKDKLLVHGKVWVDSSDYAVVRIQGELVKPPSFFLRKARITRDYAKVSDFWLPQRDESVSQLLVLGKSTMTVNYYDYNISGQQVTMAGGSR
jgi:hypothetical protein